MLYVIYYIVDSNERFLSQVDESRVPVLVKAKGEYCSDSDMNEY